MTSRRIATLALVLAAVAAGACRGENNEAASTAAAAAAPPQSVQVGAENVIRVRRGSIVVGPIVSGELKPAREATVRAQLGGSILAVNVDVGQTVQRGAIVARIDARALGESRQSAESAVRSAENQLALARREAERTAQLVSAGALAQRDLDVAQNSVATVEAQLTDARARLANADTSLRDAVVRAPLTGIVSKRAANAGDVVAPGAEMLTIIDPSSMRLEAAVPSDDLGALKLGAAVRFEVRGYDMPFEGRIERIAAQADPTTRQVPIFVTVPNTGGRLVAGLYAEGRVISQSADGLIVPINAVNSAGESPWVLRVAGGKTERVDVKVGLRDPRSEQLQIASGVNEGDVLLRGAAQGITPGTPVAVGGAE